jgi:DNA polymerase elongation subunit (family B)
MTAEHWKVQQMKFYTNVLVHKDQILHRGYNNGVRFQEKIKYQPYLFFPTHEQTEYKALDGSNVEKITYDCIKDAKETINFLKGSENSKIYGLPYFSYAFVNDQYPNIEYDQSQISILNFDIEVEADDGFPNPELAEKPINAITITHNGKIHLFSTYQHFKSDDPNVFFHSCDNEEDLLHRFLVEWRRIDPDVITGWYIDGFDIPYIVNRIPQVLTKKDVERLSPWNTVMSREYEVFGKTKTEYHIWGISSLDYLPLYKKFSFSNHESYTLNFISHHELGEKKLDYSEYVSLFELWRNDPQKFLEYNIRDAQLVDKLDDKLKFIEQVFALAYDAKVNYTDTLGTVKMWDVLSHNWLMAKNIVVPVVDIQKQAESERAHKSISGGFVKAPDPGRKNWAVSFDLTSLYPHLIMQYNISPETIRGKIESINVDHVDDIVNGKYNDYRQMMEKENVTLCPTGCYFDRETKGFFPELMERTFSLREEYKQKMLAAKRKYEHNPSEKLKKDIDRYNGAQMINKIKLNSIYGALANPYFRWYQRDLAESITSSGRLSIKWIYTNINDLLNKTLKTKDVDYIIAADTDSMYLNLEPLVDSVYEDPDTPHEEIVEFLDKVCKQWLEPYIEKSFKKLATYANAAEQKMHMKREIIADTAIWTGKKHYIMSVYDLEGVRYSEPQIKMTGVEAVKSSTPEVCRDAIKQAFEIILSKDNDDLIGFINDFFDQFKDLDFEDVAFPSSVNGLIKYGNKETMYIKGTPIRVRASLVYNNAIEENDLLRQFQIIQDGDKIKYCYMKMPNPMFENVFAAHSILPRELNLEKYIDHRVQFNKSFLEPVRRFTDVIDWTTEKINRLEGI